MTEQPWLVANSIDRFKSQIGLSSATTGPTARIVSCERLGACEEQISAKQHVTKLNLNPIIDDFSSISQNSRTETSKRCGLTIGF